MRKIMTDYAAACGISSLHIRQYAEYYHHTCGSLRNFITAFTTACGILPPHMRQYADNILTYIRQYAEFVSSLCVTMRKSECRICCSMYFPNLHYALLCGKHNMFIRHHAGTIVFDQQRYTSFHIMFIRCYAEF